MVKKRRGQSSAFMARIRKLRGSKKKSKSTKSPRRFNMAKRKRSYGKKSSAMSTGLIGTAAGVGGYILFESVIEPKILSMANVSNPLMVNVAELVGGMWLSKKKGIMGQVGKAAVVINLYQILYPYLSNIGNAASNTSALFESS